MHHYIKDYPRPQLVRNNFELLNGEWEFAFGNAENQATDFDKKINVPFTYETKMSGIGDETVYNTVWYKRSINLEELNDRRLLLHFEGVDYRAYVYINGKLVGSHLGGYARFSFDISRYVNPGINELTVKVEDSLSAFQARGKQRWIPQNFGCWYVQTTGIWKSVWMEYVDEVFVKDLKITPVLKEGEVLIEFNLDGDVTNKRVEASVDISFNEKEINSVKGLVSNGRGVFKIPLARFDIMEWGLFTWHPDHPDLYDVDFKLTVDDKASDSFYSYFGLREIRIDGDVILLNNEPLYQRLILDQGYWPDSHLTPPSEEALIKDIDNILALGYNGLRKHQKTEDERFLYWCDVKGVLVWSEMASSYTFNDDAVEEFTNQWMEIVRENYNHPCIITWTPFNESWGVLNIKQNRKQQHFTEGIYHLTKAFDDMRPVIVNDGWEHTISDIITLHDYEAEGEVLFNRYMDKKNEILENKVYHCGHRSAFSYGYEYKGQPVIISEFGGIAFNEEGGWGYGDKVNGKEDFIKRFDNITTAIKKLPYVCGYCYTQVSDVQQEINGLMKENRDFKIEPEIIKEINTRKVIR